MRYLFLLLFLVFSTNSRAQEIWALQDLINYAIKNSPSLIQAKMDVEIAGLDEDIATQNHRYGFSLIAESLTGLSIGRRVVVGGVLLSDREGTSFIEPFVSLQFNYPFFR